MHLRSFSKSARPEELRPPAFDISLITQSLTCTPYKPLRTSEERFLAHKTLFLLALASAKRVGKLHALSYPVSHSRDWGEVSFSFVPGFVVKTQNPSSFAPWFEGFFGLALPNLNANRNGILLCLVRAVRCYLARTAPHHPHCKRLLITAGRDKKEIVKNTVSFWFRKAISRAYQLLSGSCPARPREPGRPGVSPHLFFSRRTLLSSRC